MKMSLFHIRVPIVIEQKQRQTWASRVVETQLSPKVFCGIELKFLSSTSRDN